MNLNFISKDQRWHAWRGASTPGTAYLLSDEDNKKLTYHMSIDEMILYLWSSDFKGVARELNQCIKEQK